MKQERKPAHPGQILKNMYLKPLKLTVTKLAKTLHVSRKAISAITNEHKSITPEMALRLGRAFNTTPDLWLNLQKNYDLWCVINTSSDWQKISPVDMTLESA